jgi:hypothetical protein
MPESDKDPLDEAESAIVEGHAKQLGEHFDAVVVLCTRHDGARGTRTCTKGSGNWHAQYGVVKEWLENFEEKLRIEARDEVEERRKDRS